MLLSETLKTELKTVHFIASVSLYKKQGCSVLPPLGAWIAQSES
jgi:hypothetical protein